MKTARELALASLDAVAGQQREAWLALFADDAVVEDPVGKSVFDPSGQGHRGREAIAGFYDRFVCRNKAFSYVIREWHACGDEVASAATFTMVGPDDVERQLDLITVHKATADGKLASIRAFWTFDGIAARAAR
jgi:ketosteroid isomerase-like protein